MKFSTASLILLLLTALCSGATFASSNHIEDSTPALLPSSSNQNQTVAPIYIRLFKEERTLEIWQENSPGHYTLRNTFPICHYSGLTGPKLFEGDRQSPEGFYSLTADRMNPNSRFHLALDIGFPNEYDRAHGRTGSALMIHGDCVSKGCYAMTDRYIEDIYTVVGQAFAAGQHEIPIHIFPFRMNGLNMDYYRQSPWIGFWQQMRKGYQLFERNSYPPHIEVVDGRYIISSGMTKQLTNISPSTLFAESE
ncbi:MAG: murein L,D-transpeptidase [Candidatus Polarisedimenticolaceae bacterium]|nr:murein L,D-transpeptidase [Candidatus Polarisedimenticolaceae bacterium]